MSPRVMRCLREGDESSRSGDADIVLFKLCIDHTCYIFRVGIFKQFQTGKQFKQAPTDVERSLGRNYSVDDGFRFAFMRRSR